MTSQVPQLVSYDSDDVLCLSHSSRNTLDNCAKRFWFTKLMQMRVNQNSMASSGGHAMHSAWYTMLRGGEFEDALWTLIQEFPIHRQKSAMENWSIQQCYWALDSLWRNDILSTYDLAQIQRTDGSIVEAIEVPFAIHILDDSGKPFQLCLANGQTRTVVYIGYMDAILYDMRTERYKVVDLKNTSLITKDYRPIYQFDSQCMPYALVLETILGRTFTTLDVEYVVTVIDALEPRVLPLSFTKDQEDIDELTRSFAMQLRKLATFAQTDWWPREPKACFSFNRSCTYATDMCGSRNPDYLASMFAITKQQAARDEAKLGAIPTNARPAFEPWFRVDLRIDGLRGGDLT